MTEPVWLTHDAVMAIHEDLIAEYGGLDGIRDAGLLDSGLARPQNGLAYGEPTLFDLAAAYCAGIVRNHPFIDGNKRIAFAAMAMFLSENGYEFVPDKMDSLETIMRLAAGDIKEDELARWVGENCRQA